MKLTRIFLLTATLLVTTTAFAEVPVVDAYQQDDTAADTSSSTKNNVEVFGTEQTAPLPPSPTTSEQSQAVVSSSSSNLSTEQRLSILERQVNNLSQVLKQISGMQQQLQDLHGQVEVSSHDLQTLQTQLKSQYQDLDQRLSKRNTQVALQTQESPTPSKKTSLPENNDKNETKKEPKIPKSLENAEVETAGSNATTAEDQSSAKTKRQTTAATSDDEQIAYQNAFNALKQRKYDQATRTFQSFVKKYPTSKNLVNSRYWLGQLFLLQGQPEQAITQFNVILKKYANDPKVPDALLQLGLAYYAKGDLNQAKTSLNKVQQKYPQSSAAKLAKTRLQQIIQAGEG